MNGNELNNLFDTHTHMLDRRFSSDLDELLGRLPGQGVKYIVEACCEVGSIARKAVAIAERYDYVYTALGTHPHEAKAMKDEHMDVLRTLLPHKKVVAVGEIGLDYHYDFSPRDVQKKWFIAQLELAIELNMPAIFHVREADGEALEILKAYKNGLRGVMHCFSGSYETACDCLDMGLYVAFGGAITFENARRNVDVARRLPLDRLLIETDCPYMTPTPYRGKRNDPSLVYLVCQRLAELHGISAQRMADITLNNGMKLFGITG